MPIIALIEKENLHLSLEHVQHVKSKFEVFKGEVRAA